MLYPCLTADRWSCSCAPQRRCDGDHRTCLPSNQLLTRFDRCLTCRQVELLLSYGADVTLTNRWGECAADDARKAGSAELVALLTKRMEEVGARSWVPGAGCQKLGARSWMLQGARARQQVRKAMTPATSRPSSPHTHLFPTNINLPCASAVTPSVTPALNPAANPAATPVVTPSVTPSVTPAATTCPSSDLPCQGAPLPACCHHLQVKNTTPPSECPSQREVPLTGPKLVNGPLTGCCMVFCGHAPPSAYILPAGCRPLQVKNGIPPSEAPLNARDLLANSSIGSDRASDAAKLEAQVDGGCSTYTWRLQSHLAV